MDLAALYKHRFAPEDRPRKIRIWNVLCSQFFQPIVGKDKIVLDLACGYGEFINAITAREKYAVDLNPDAANYVNEGIKLFKAPATAIPLPNEAIDVVFTSNFLEHLRTKDECDQVFAEVKRILKPRSRFIIMGPNIRYLADRYWDYYDHHLPLSHLSLEEGLLQAGYGVELNIPKFLPYTAKSTLPSHPALVALYLKVPLAWRIMGRQFLIVATKL
jgi:SAM-dependent methyltransferase